MKIKVHILFYAILLVLVSFKPAFADIYDDITTAVKTGNSKELSHYFSSRVDLKISNTEDLYSKDQAEIILKNFFQRNTPINFTIKHKGASAKGLPYIIGDFQTSNGTYRTYFLFKHENSNLLIQELHFEKE